MSENTAEKVVPISKAKKQAKIPEPFFVHNNTLWMNIKGEEVDICRQVPLILRKFVDIENFQVSYELMWKEDSIKFQAIVSSKALSVKKELLELTSKDLGVNENNYRKMIDYFDRFLRVNEIKTQKMVSRLGFTEVGFAHPALNDEDVMIVPTSDKGGEKQLLEAIQQEGTLESWKNEVLSLAKPHPKAMFYIVASFASILLEDLKVRPFIVDYAGGTSQGKSTLLHLATTVWGTEKLYSIWNTTNVNIEQRAAFLNNLPLMFDDTKKVENPKDIEKALYQFSSGQGKGRGGLQGFQAENRWNNILLSNGETPIIEQTNSPGVVGRIVQFVDHPFGKTTPDFFTEIYRAMYANYGVAGIEFVKKWANLNKEEKQNLISQFHILWNKYANRATGNDVLVRTSAYYALIEFTSNLLNDFLNLEIDNSFVEELFVYNLKNSREANRPKAYLEDLLAILDRSKHTILYPKSYTPPTAVNALMDTKGNLYLTTDFVKQNLKENAAAARREWQRQSLILTQKDGGDTKLVTCSQQRMRGLQVNNDILAEFGYDFKQYKEDDE